MSLSPLLLVFALYTLNPVTIGVYPPFSLPPATFRITVLVPRHAQNRSLCLGYRVVGESDPLRNSCRDLAGAEAERVRTVFWDVRESGEFEATAILTRMEDGHAHLYRSVQPFRVIGHDDP